MKHPNAHLVFVKLSFLKTTFYSPLTPPLYQLRPELQAEVILRKIYATY